MPGTISHKNFTGADAVHPAWYKQSTDPGATGPAKGWVDTSSGPPYQLKVRNAGDTAWEFVGSIGVTDPTTTRGDLITRSATALQRFALGAVSSILTSNGTDPVWSVAPTLSGLLTALYLKATGLAGSTGAARLVGSTASGAPATGTWEVADVAVDSTGKLWVCTGAGTPGAWVQTSGTMTNPMTTNQDVIVGGSTPAAGSPTRVAVGANGQVLTVVSGVVAWANSAAGFGNPMTSPGDLISATVGGSPVRIPIGANSQVLTVVGGLAGWVNPSGGGGGTTVNTAVSLYMNSHYI